MSTANDPVFHAALALPPGERAELALQLWESLSTIGSEVVIDPSWVIEIVARQKLVESGEYVAYGAEESIRRAREALAQREQP